MLTTLLVLKYMNLHPKKLGVERGLRIVRFLPSSKLKGEENDEKTDYLSTVVPVPHPGDNQRHGRNHLRAA
jgi:hypothetical protein